MRSSPLSDTVRGTQHRHGLQVQAQLSEVSRFRCSAASRSTCLASTSLACAAPRLLPATAARRWSTDHRANGPCSDSDSRGSNIAELSRDVHVSAYLIKKICTGDLHRFRAPLYMYNQSIIRPIRKNHRISPFTVSGPEAHVFTELKQLGPSLFDSLFHLHSVKTARPTLSPQ